MINTKFTILRTDGTEEVRTERMNAMPGYMVLQVLLRPILACEWVERVKVLHNGKRTDLFVDEVSFLRKLPRNEKATAIYRNAVLTADPSTDPESLAAIHGDAVLFSRVVWD